MSLRDEAPRPRDSETLGALLPSACLPHPFVTDQDAMGAFLGQASPHSLCVSSSLKYLDDSS